MSVKIAGNTTNTDMEVDTTAKAGRVTLYDLAGNPISSMIDSGGHYRVRNAVVQEVYTSTLNSSTANIVNGVTWSGGWETTLGVAAIQVHVKTDRRCTVTVDQSIANDGVVDTTYSYSVPANFGSARTTQATGAYFRISVTNVGATPTTSVRIGSFLCPVAEALPRDLTPGGSLRVSLNADWQDNNKTLGMYGTSTFRVLGNTTDKQNLLSIENPVGSTVIVAVRGVSAMVESTVALLTQSGQFKSSRTTNMPTNGTVLVPVKFRTDFTGATAIVRNANAGDDGVATAITATEGVTLWSQFMDRQATNVGLIQRPCYNLIPDVGSDLRQLLLMPGEAFLIQVISPAGAGATTNPATNHYVANINWYEMQY